MFEAINSVLDAIVQASRPRGVNAWLIMLFALGVIWYVAAGAMYGATDPIAVPGGLLAAAALLALVARSVLAIRRERTRG